MRYVALTLLTAATMLGVGSHAQAQFTQNAFTPTLPQENIPDRNAYTPWAQQPGNRPYPDTTLIFQVDGLLWMLPRTKVPTITTGSARDAVPGALGQPGTSTLFGENVTLNPFTGVRGAFAWMQAEYEIEFNGFYLGQQSRDFNAQSGVNGNLFLAFLNQTPPATGQEAAFPISSPANLLVGNVDITTTTQFWGLETNFYKPLWEEKCFGGGMLFGYRYLNLRDHLTMQTAQTLRATITSKTFDEFTAQNQFHGFQIGARGSYKVLPTVSVDAVAKIALGVSAMDTETNGSTIISSVAAPGVARTTAGGILALPSNIGARSNAEFSYVPQGQMKVVWGPYSWMHVSLGYEVLYWSEVARAGDQIDRNLNLTQRLGGALTGPAVPAPRLITNDFFAHGIFGSIEFAY